MLKRFTTICSLLSLVLLLVTSCSEEQRQKYDVTPQAYGNIDHILVVTDPYIWENSLGDTLRHYFEALFPVTPQPEGIFDLRHKDPQSFFSNQVLKTYRSMIIMASLDDEDDPSVKFLKRALGKERIEKAMNNDSYSIAIQKDRWADGQLIVYWFAPTRQKLLESIVKNNERIINQFQDRDFKHLVEEVYALGEEDLSTVAIKQNLGIDLRIPKAYKIAHKQKHTVWLRQETEKVSSNIWIYTLPLTEKTQISETNHHQLRNALTIPSDSSVVPYVRELAKTQKEALGINMDYTPYFSSTIDSTYIEIDDRYLPVRYQLLTANGHTMLQARGLWSVVNDFMGGPFISYMIEDPARKRCIFIDGFVFAPGQKKRVQMRKLDAIFSTLKIVE